MFQNHFHRKLLWNYVNKWVHVCKSFMKVYKGDKYHSRKEQLKIPRKKENAYSLMHSKENLGTYYYCTIFKGLARPLLC